MAPSYIDSLFAIFRNKSRKKPKKKESTKDDSPSTSRSSRTTSRSTEEEDIDTTNSTDHTGRAIYITDCIGVTIGDHYTYYNGIVYYNQNHYTYTINYRLYDWLEDRDQLEMAEDIIDINLLMECTSKITRKYLVHTAEYTGSRWQKTFISLGVDDRIIQNYLYKNPRESIQEIRYQILRDWQRNSDNTTLGYLSTKLWENGHRRLVNELAIMYRVDRLRMKLKVEI